MAAIGSNVRAGKAFVEIALDDSRLQKGLRAAQARLKSFGASLASAGGKILGLAAMAAAPFAFATRTFADFDDEMRMTRAVSGAAGAEFQMLAETAERLGRETSFMAKEVAQGMTAMGRMGFKPREINEAIAAVLNLARATGTDLGLAAEIAANNMRVFGFASSEMAGVSDILTAAANGSAQTLADLAEGLKMAGPQAAAAKDDIRNVAGALGVLANMGIKGSLAGTALRKSYSQFARTGIQDKLKALGIETLDKDGNLRAMPDIMADIAQEMAGMPTGRRLAFAEEIFDLRGALAGLQLGGNIGQLRAFVEMLKNAKGAAAATAAEMDKGLGGALRIFFSAVEGVQITVGRILGDALAPYINKMSLLLNNLAEWIAAHKDAVIAMAKMIAAAAAAGAALLAVGMSAKALAAAIGGLSIAFTLLRAVVLAPLAAIKLAVGAHHLLTGAIALSKAAALACWAAIASPAFLAGAALAAATALVWRFTGAWGICARAAGNVGRQASAGLASIGGVLKESWDALKAAFMSDDMAGAARVGLAALKLAWMAGIMPLKKAWAELQDFLHGSWAVAVYSLLKLGGNLWHGLLAGMQEIGDAIADTWGFLWNGIADGFESTLAWLQKRWISFRGFFGGDINVEAEIARIDAQAKASSEERRAAFADDVDHRARGRAALAQDRDSVNAAIEQAMIRELSGSRAKRDSVLLHAQMEARLAADEWKKAMGDARRNAEARQGRIDAAKEKAGDAAIGTEKAARLAGAGGDSAIGSWSLGELGRLLAGGGAEERTASAAENAVRLQREANKFLRKISTQALAYGG